VYLRRHSISGFVAHSDIEPTSKWENTIEYALNTCDALLALVTRDYGKSLWCDQEVGYALGRGVLVIPVTVNTDPYGFIGKFQGLKGAGKKPEQLANSVQGILMKNETTLPKMVEVLVAEFESSNTFNESKVNISKWKSWATYQTIL
jgi:hypothetical protein